MELKPCPFCTKQPRVHYSHWYDVIDPNWVQVRCVCGMRGPKHSYDGLADAKTCGEYAGWEWNTRV